MNKQLSWDIFCRVIDNFGDIGVCWRLARQLAGEFEQPVRLWVDDLASLHRIWPAAGLTDQQHLEGIELRLWAEDFPPDIQPAEVVIEAFACDIPESYLQSMASKRAVGQAPLWINLEYLSAEKWVEDYHLMTSIHPSTGLRKRFFFPGFTPATGGLLREQQLEARDSFDKALFLKGINIQPQPGSLLISMFAYENPAIQGLLHVWSKSETPIHCLIPQGKILATINSFLTSPLLPGSPQTLDNLRLETIPFLTQSQYDHLLWACDVNFVRGEDSFVRAQWAGKPFVWHIYPQDEMAHMDKLNAFLDLFEAHGRPEVAHRLRDLWHRWNLHENPAEAWEALAANLTEWESSCQDWRQSLAAQADLAQQLINLAMPSHA